VNWFLALKEGHRVKVNAERSLRKPTGLTRKEVTEEWKCIYIYIAMEVKFTLQQAMKAYSFFNLGARLRRVVNVTPGPLYPRERDPVPIV
jgi:hypothetical protein